MRSQKMNQVQKRLFSSTIFNLQKTSTSQNYLNDVFNDFSQSLKKSSNSSVGVKQAPSIKTKYKPPTPPIGVPVNKLFSNSFPLSFRQSFYDYKERHKVLDFQHDLLSTLPFYPEPDFSGRSSKVLKVELDDENKNFINEFVIYPPGKSEVDTKSLNHLILLHGYGAGLGFYLKNFDGLSVHDNWCIHAIDLLGYGCSSRPEFKLEKENLQHVEKWFHESFHTWKTKRGLNDPSRILVAAHSMGAYLTATYSMNYPNQFKKLIMVSPGAVIFNKKKLKVPSWFAHLWEKNYSPFSLIRKSGPFGSVLTSGWTSRRFAKLTSMESKLLHKYSYGIFNSPGSGEYMLNYLLSPGADARYPLIERIDQITCDMSWIYGEQDWMDINGGVQCTEIIKSKTRFHSNVLKVKTSGHHVYLDNYKTFNELIVKEMRANYP